MGLISFLRGFLLALPAAVLACNGEDLSGPTTGALQVTTTTSGTEVDPDGYTVQVDADQPLRIGSSSTLQTAGIAPGNHAIRLAGITPNCSLAGDNPRSITIVVRETASVLFQLTCSVTTGTLMISTTTTGVSQDADGYILRIDGGEPQSIGLNASLKVSAVSGPHSVALRDVAANCNVVGKDPRRVVVSSGSSASADFHITCSAPGIRLPGAG